jgi:PAS domain S-box-containing protein
MMLNKLKKWLSPPVFEDEEKTRIAKISNTVLLSVIAVLGVYTFARPELFLQDSQAVIANSIILLLLISQLLVLRRGWVRAASIMVTSLAWVNLTAQAWIFGGVRDASFAAYILIILVANLLLGWQAGVMFLGLSILAGLGLAHAEVSGILRFAPDGPYALWVDHSLNFVIATIMVAMMATSLSRALERARRNERDLTKSNRDLQAIRTSLEEQITERTKAQEELQESEQRYRQLVKHAPAGIYEIDFVNDRFTSVNDVMCDYTGYSQDEFLSLSPYNLLTKDSREHFLTRLEKLMAGEEIPETVEYKIKSKSGQEFWVLVYSKAVYEHGQPIGATVIAHNITERKRAEEELKQSEEWLKILFEYAPDAYYLSDLKGTFIDGNRAAEKAVGYQREELIGKNFLKLKLLSPRQIPRAAGLLAKNVFGIPTGPDEFVLSRKDGSQVIVEISTYPIKHNRQTVVLGIARDITERKQTERELERHRHHLEELVTARTAELTELNQQLQHEIRERRRAEEQIKASLKEKEVLLKEIHHRVKNNLQIISSLLHLHAGYINDQQALEIFQDSQNRVRSMALIHEKLYRSSNLAQIDFAEYVRDLTDYLFRAQKADLQGIDLSIQADTIFLDIDAAIPCGLILNELVSNSLKHAFPIGRQGEICINLIFENDQRVILKVRDDGIGFPAELDFRATESLGLQLVNTLVNQLNGKIELDSSYGTNFKIMFNLSE